MKWVGGVRLFLLAAVSLLPVLAACSARPAQPVATPKPAPPIASDPVGGEANVLLSRYGYHIRAVGLTTPLTLPSKWLPGERSSVDGSDLELASKAVGLDLAPYLGQTVQAFEIDLKEQAYGEPLSAIFLIANGKLVGAYLEFAGFDRGRIRPLSWRPPRR
jgi:hypothetical protein